MKWYHALMLGYLQIILLSVYHPVNVWFAFFAAFAFSAKYYYFDKWVVKRERDND